jgi:hypothetical protein
MSFEGMNRRDFMKLAGSAVATTLVEGGSKENIDDDIPSNESIIAVFEILTKNRESKERRKGVDSHGVYLWEVEFEVDDGFVEFNYMRKGSHEIGGSASATKIHIIYSDENGKPYDGTDIARFSNGQWTRDAEFFQELEDSRDNS